MNTIDRRSLLGLSGLAGLFLATQNSTAEAQPRSPDVISPLNPLAPQKLAKPFSKKTLIIGAGLAGLSAALELADRGYAVEIYDAMPIVGGKLATRNISNSQGNFNVEHGLHMWFHNYHVFQDIRDRLGINKNFTPYNTVDFLFRDYEPEALKSDPQIYPLNLFALMKRSPNLNLLDAVGQLNAMWEVMNFNYDKMAHLDKISFLDWAKNKGVDKKFFDIIMEPAASVTLNDVSKISAYEMVLYMHLYFLSNPKAMNRDVTTSDHNTAVLKPWVDYLKGKGVVFHLDQAIETLEFNNNKVTSLVTSRGFVDKNFDHLVLATEAKAAHRILKNSKSLNGPSENLRNLTQKIGSMKTAPHYKVLRVWLDKAPLSSRPAVIETPQHKPINLMAEFNKLEKESAAWADQTGGSILEFHLYANDALKSKSDAQIWPMIESLVVELLPELDGAQLLDFSVGSYDNFSSFEVGQASLRPSTHTPLEMGLQNLTLAGDWCHTAYPSALMERAVCTGREAANHILLQDGVRQASLKVVSKHGPGLI
jgi:isorenieratene synthase